MFLAIIVTMLISGITGSAVTVEEPGVYKFTNEQVLQNPPALPCTKH